MITETEKCVFDLGTYAHNPLKEWLQDRKEEEYPLLRIESNSVLVDWGLAEKFSCNLTSSKIKSVQLKMHHGAIILKDRQTSVSKLIPTEFKSLQNSNLIDLRCLSWKVKLDLKIEMLKYKGKIIYKCNKDEFLPMYRKSPGKKVLPTI